MNARKKLVLVYLSTFYAAGDINTSSGRRSLQAHTECSYICGRASPSEGHVVKPDQPSLMNSLNDSRRLSSFISALVIVNYRGIRDAPMHRYKKGIHSYVIIENFSIRIWRIGVSRYNGESPVSRIVIIEVE